MDSIGWLIGEMLRQAPRRVLQRATDQTGRSASVAPTRGERFVDVLKVLGDDETAEACTVTLLRAAGDPGADAVPQLVARVEWGQGGSSTVAEVDVGPLGTVLTVHGAMVKVSVTNFDAPPVGAQVKNAIDVSGFVAYKPRGAFSIAPVRSFVPVLAVAPALGSTVTILVPAYTRTLSVRSNAVGDPVDTTVRDRLGAVILTRVGAFERMPLPGLAFDVQVTNTAAAIIRVDVMFELAL